MRQVGNFQQNAVAPNVRKVPNARRFDGNGESALPVPGLMEVERVFVGEMEIPLTEVIVVPMNADQTEKERLEDALIQLTDDADGNRVLMRSYRSNLGIWQDGATVTVIGTWMPGVEQPLEDMSREQLRELAKAHKIRYNGNTPKSELILALQAAGVGKVEEAA